MKNSAREFWFQTPPKIGPDAPYTFGIIGKLYVPVFKMHNLLSSGN